MSRRLLALPVVLLAFQSGCLKNGTRRDAIKPLPSDPGSARAAPPTRPQLPSPIAKQDPPPVALPDTAPVVKLPSADPTAAPPLLSPPALPNAGASGDSTDDDRKPLRERIRERLDERKERREEKTEKEKKAPTLPSPIAPKSPMPPAAEAPKSSASPDARAIYQRAADRFAKLPDYESRLVRREVIGGKAGATEEVLFQFRQQPFSVYMRNTGEAGHGREVLYVRGKFEDKMHIVTGEGDNRLVGAGYRTALKPDSPMATSRSRHMITEAGFNTSLAKFSRALDAGLVKSLGKVSRKEYPYPLDGVELTLRPGDEPSLPTGGKQQIYFDPNPESGGYGLPVLVLTFEPGDREVEYYCFDRVRAPAGLTDADFTPDRLGGKKK